MTTARLAAIQRGLGLDVTVVGKPGRPGAFAPQAVAAHWTASRSTPSRPAPSLNVVRDGRKGLPGPLYGDLIPYQDDPTRLRVIQITVGRTNNFGMGRRQTIADVAAGRPVPRQPAADTHGLNGLVDAVSVDYHPDQGRPTAAMVEALVRALAARCIYRALPPHAVLDHAQGTRRKIDLLTGFPDPVDLRRRVAAAMRATAAPPPAPTEDDVIRTDDRDRNGDTAVRDLEELTNNFLAATGSTLDSDFIAEDGVWSAADAKHFTDHVVGRLRGPAFHQLQGLTLGKHASGQSVSPAIQGLMAAVIAERR